MVSPWQDLLKHTPEDHPDHPFLIDAQRNIKQVAERINKGMKSAEEVERNARIVQEIESHIEGMEDVRMGVLAWGPGWGWVMWTLAAGHRDKRGHSAWLNHPREQHPYLSCTQHQTHGVSLSFHSKLSHFWGLTYVGPPVSPFGSCLPRSCLHGLLGGSERGQGDKSEWWGPGVGTKPLINLLVPTAPGPTPQVPSTGDGGGSGKRWPSVPCPHVTFTLAAL